MLLVFDVGNTNITLGIYKGEELICTGRIVSGGVKTPKQYSDEILNIINKNDINKNQITGSIISSVVPKLTIILKKVVKDLINLTPYIVTEDLVPNLKVKGASVSNLGADLIVGFVAAQKKYGYPNIVIDMGTATTVFVMDKDGFVLGGSILPGFGISLEALTGKAAQLAPIDIQAPPKVIGTNTMHCIQSGMVFGTAVTLDGMCQEMENELGYKCKIIATGGLAGIVTKHCEKEIILDDRLLLDGLKIIYDNQEK